MASGARIFLEPIRSPQWFDSVAARVSMSLLLLVLLAIPTFLLLVHDPGLILWYLFYPVGASVSLYLRSKGNNYSASVLIVISVYGVFAWMSWLVGFDKITELMWWIVALLPWVMFEEKQRITPTVLSLLPIIFSFTSRFLPRGQSPLFPAEQEFVRQILGISVALGAFSCIYFLRHQYLRTETMRVLENEFYSNTLNSIPLPIIIKDGITLEYIFYNEAAQLTYDLRTGHRHSNTTTFSEACAAAVSRLDHEALRSVTFHLEGDENLVHQTGLHWHFRTYRIPLEIQSSGRRLLITISEDLRAINVLLQQAEETRSLTEKISHLLSPLVVRYDRLSQKVVVVTPAEWPSPFKNIHSDIKTYLEFYFARLPAGAPAAQHIFQLGNFRLLACYGSVPKNDDLHAVVLTVPGQV